MTPLLPTLAIALVLCAAGDALQPLGLHGEPAPVAGRAEPDSTPDLSLVLNVPARRLDVLERGREVRSYVVAVGTPDHPTPLGRFEIDRIVWNPWWIPPPFDWARGMEVTPPCEQNPTGRVKLFFGYYLYIHGTPLEETLGTAASHGCVRLSNSDAIELARTVHRHVSPDIAPATLDSLEAHPQRTRTLRLARVVPLEVRYHRVEVRAGRLEIHPDVYRLETLSREEVQEILRAAGVAGALDPARLDAAIEEGSRSGLAVPITDLRAAHRAPVAEE
jgi:murein L,D-transpeptidase YcbB/YkuD